jgi:hypothetical protein
MIIINEVEEQKGGKLENDNVKIEEEKKKKEER